MLKESNITIIPSFGQIPIVSKVELQTKIWKYDFFFSSFVRIRPTFFEVPILCNKVQGLGQTIKGHI